MFIPSIRECDERRRALAESAPRSAELLRALLRGGPCSDADVERAAGELLQLVELARHQSTWLRAAGGTPSVACEAVPAPARAPKSRVMEGGFARRASVEQADDPTRLTVPQVLKRLGRSLGYLYKLRRDGKLPAPVDGGGAGKPARYDATEVDEAIAQLRSGGQL